MKLFREYKDVFAWTYEDLKTYDTKIIQHVIQLKENAKPFSAEAKTDASFIRATSEERVKQATRGQDHISCPTYHLGGKTRTSKEEVERYKDLYRFQKLESSKSKR